MRAKALWTGLRGRPRAIMEATIAEVTIVAAQLADWLAIMEVTIVAAQLVDWLAIMEVTIVAAQLVDVPLDRLHW